MHSFARPAGDRRGVAALVCLWLSAMAIVCPSAGAQIPDLLETTRDVVEGTGEVVEDTANDVVDAPLPAPVEDVVADTPVAPVREEVRRIVDEATGGQTGGGGGSGGTGGGGGAGGTGGNAPATGGSGDTSGPAGGDAPRSSDPRRSRGERRDRRGRRRPASSRGDAGAPGAGGVRALAAPGAEPQRSETRRSAGEDAPERERSAAVRTINTIVKAVPTPIWVALGLLAILAAALGARTVVERRRARALAGDRERLLRDVAVLERALLPAVPERVGGVAASVAYRSCDGPAAGGDFYDAFELPDGRAVVLVGDVSGHGPDALEGTNAVRSQLHALLEGGMSPREALAEVGRRDHDALSGRFTTVVVGAHDPGAGTLTYATAGHPAPIVVGPGAEEPLTAAGSPPLGVELRTGLRETTVPLPPGSLACFFTDGLFEARAGGDMIGRGRLTELLASLGPEDQAEALLELVLATADEAADDMAVCLLRPVASGAGPRPPRMEVLEVDSDDLDSGLAERFLELCGVPAPELAATLDSARAAVALEGVAVVEVAIADGVGRPGVSRPRPGAAAGAGAASGAAAAPAAG